MRKIISMSLWGTDKMYLCGVIANVKNAKEVYPGWDIILYCDYPISKTHEVHALEYEQGCIIITNPYWVPEENIGFEGLFWRFKPVYEWFADAVIVRDADARVGFREADAVNEWLESGKMFHSMRDHPNHKNHIMGGMWGCRPTKQFRKMFKSCMQKFLSRLEDVKFNDDQIFLNTIIYPRIKTADILVHSSFFRFEDEQTTNFKVERNGIFDFVGNKYKDDGTPVYSLESR